MTKVQNMEEHFTPLEPEKLKKDNNVVNTVLLIIITVTAGVLATLLFILINKSLNK